MANLSGFVKRLRDIMRNDAGINGDAQRITGILAEPTFSFSPEQLVSIHRRLFDGIYKHAGTIRDYNITKNEWVLKGDTVQYASCFRLVE